MIRVFYGRTSGNFRIPFYQWTIILEYRPRLKKTDVVLLDDSAHNAIARFAGAVTGRFDNLLDAWCFVITLMKQSQWCVNHFHKRMGRKRCSSDAIYAGLQQSRIANAKAISEKMNAVRQSDHPAKYIGPLTHLVGMTALIRKTESVFRVKAQFDDFKAKRFGKVLALGWHAFKASEFELVTPLRKV